VPLLGARPNQAAKQPGCPSTQVAKERGLIRQPLLSSTQVTKERGLIRQPLLSLTMVTRRLVTRSRCVFSIEFPKLFHLFQYRLLPFRLPIRTNILCTTIWMKNQSSRIKWRVVCLTIVFIKNLPPLSNSKMKLFIRSVVRLSHNISKVSLV
jgi:hypothetical protein